MLPLLSPSLLNLRTLRPSPAHWLNAELPFRPGGMRLIYFFYRVDLEGQTLEVLTQWPIDQDKKTHKDKLFPVHTSTWQVYVSNSISQKGLPLFLLHQRRNNGVDYILKWWCLGDGWIEKEKHSHGPFTLDKRQSDARIRMLKCVANMYIKFPKANDVWVMDGFQRKRRKSLGSPNIVLAVINSAYCVATIKILSFILTVLWGCVVCVRWM